MFRRTDVTDLRNRKQERERRVAGMLDNLAAFTLALTQDAPPTQHICAVHRDAFGVTFRCEYQRTAHAALGWSQFWYVGSERVSRNAVHAVLMSACKKFSTE